MAQAAIGLARRDYAAVPEDLRRATPYERGFIAALAPAYLRAEAQRLAGDHAAAASGFAAVLANRGADPFSPFVPLAQLGLSRTLASAGGADGSRRAREALLVWWKDADSGWPLFREIQAAAR